MPGKSDLKSGIVGQHVQSELLQEKVVTFVVVSLILRNVKVV